MRYDINLSDIEKESLVISYAYTKIILYTILVFCILWALVLTAGPRLITALVKQNYDNSVLVSGLRITPKLGISADRVDYLQLKTPTGQILNGFSRAIKLNWGGF